MSRRRLITAAIAATAMTGLYVAIIYGFFRYAWPNLPPWLSMLCFIALAVFAIGSPIFWLLQIGRNTPVPRHLLKKRDEK